MAKLILNPTSSSRREIPLARTLLSIGRDPSNDLVLPDALVSRRHAVIECRANQYVIRDCNSSNGSLVNGDRVTEHPLKDGDLLAIGTARLLFRAVEAEDAAAKVVPHPSSPKLQCPSCQADYRRGDLFCRKCGHSLPPPAPAHATCGSCGKSVPLPANYCNSCGAPLPREDGLEATRPRGRVEGPAADGSAPPEAIGSEPAPGGSSVPPRPPESAAVPPPVAEVASPAVAGGGGPKVMLPPTSPRPAPAPAAMPRPRAPEAMPAARPAARPVPPPPAARRTLESTPTPSVWRAEAAPAGFGVRLLAGLIDSVVVGAVGLLLMTPAAFYFQRVLAQAPDTPAEPGFLPILLSVALVVVAVVLGSGYYVYYWGVRGATPGKKIMDLEVQGENGEMPIGVGRALLRLLGYILSGALLGLGFLMIAFAGEGLHDRLASTRVVRGSRVRS